MRFTFASFPAPACGCNKTTPLQIEKAFLVTSTGKVNVEVNLNSVGDLGPKDCVSNCFRGSLKYLETYFEFNPVELVHMVSRIA